MKALTSLAPISKWILRITLFLYVFSLYFKNIAHFNLNSLNFYISLIYVLFGFLLILGGFFSNDNLTIISSFVIFIISIYSFIKLLPHPIDNVFFKDLIPASISFYFLSTGNKNS